MELDFKCSDLEAWNEALSSYESRIESLNKPDLVSLDQFYRVKLPSLLHDRDPNPYLTTSELSQLMKWKLSRGKWRYYPSPSLSLYILDACLISRFKLLFCSITVVWRPRLLDFVSSLEDSVVKSASEKAFKSLPDISKAVKELTVLKGVGPATASAVLAAYAPDIVPFMSDEVNLCVSIAKEESWFTLFCFRSDFSVLICLRQWRWLLGAQRITLWSNTCCLWLSYKKNQRLVVSLETSVFVCVSLVS